jgi:transposase
MSLQPCEAYQVPEETDRVAHAIFPNGNVVMRIYDDLGMLIHDQDFADLFPAEGQPAEAPVRLALVTLLQFMEGLTDCQAADAVRTRIDWKYTLCLTLTDSGFDHTVLSEFRSRYIGLLKTHLQHLMTAAAINTVRLLLWLAGEPKTTTLLSPFAQLYTATAA